jgi:hypothetical protein
VIGAAIALIVVGLVLGLILPPFGFAPALIGLILLVLFLVGFGKRAKEDSA